MPQKGLDPLQEGLPEAVHDVVADLRTVYTDGRFDRLRAVEDAIVAARTGGADLVTVSSATCSRMLSPRRTAEGRTALPRWPSVKSFLAVHGVDAAPFEQRWARARAAWAAVGGEPEIAPEAVSEVDPEPVERPRRTRLVHLALAGLLLFAAGTGFGLFLGRDEETEARAVAPVSLPGAEESAGPTGVNCDLGDEEGTVRFLSVAAEDGGVGIPLSIRVDAEVVRPAAPGNTYWLMLRLFTEGLPFYAKAPVRSDTGPASFVLRFDSPVGSVRDLFVVEADPAASAWLQESFERDGDPSWAQKRGSLPPGTVATSGTCRVERTR